MDTIKRKHKGVTRTYNVYTRKEALEASIEAKHWVLCKAGDWGISDDHYVSECMERSEWVDGREIKRVRIKFPFEMHTLLSFKKDGTLYGNPELLYTKDRSREWIRREMGRTRTKNLLELYIRMMLGRIPYSNEILIGAYRQDQKNPMKTIHMILRQPEVQNYIMNEIENILMAEGLTKRRGVAMLREAFDEAKVLGQPSVMRGVAKDIITLWGMDKTSKQIMNDGEVEAEYSVEQELLEQEKEFEEEEVKALNSAQDARKITEES